LIANFCKELEIIFQEKLIENSHFIVLFQELYLLKTRILQTNAKNKILCVTYKVTLCHNITKDNLVLIQNKIWQLE
jgi:hypothetical protein